MKLCACPNHNYMTGHLGICVFVKIFDSTKTFYSEDIFNLFGFPDTWRIDRSSGKKALNMKVGQTINDNAHLTGKDLNRGLR